MICPEQYRARVGMFRTRRVLQRGTSSVTVSTSTSQKDKSIFLTTSSKLSWRSKKKMKILLIPTCFGFSWPGLYESVVREGIYSYLPAPPCLLSSCWMETVAPTPVHLLSMLLIMAGIEVNPGPNQDTMRRFMLAAIAGDLETVRSLLIQYPILAGVTDERDQTSLMKSAGLGQTAIARVLVEWTYDLEETDINGSTAFLIAAQEGKTDILELLHFCGAKLTARNTMGFTPLLKAALNGHTATVTKLVEWGADMEDIGPRGNTALLIAIHQGNTDTVQFLLSCEANVSARNDQGVTPLLIAAQRGYSAICHLLLSYGSDVKEKSCNKQCTALHDAAIYGHITTLKVLLSFEAPVDSPDTTGTTPLHLAAQEGWEDCVLELLRAGASMTLSMKSGYTAIHRGASDNRVGVVQVLLEHGCDKDLCDRKNGQTPLMTAACRGSDQTIALLLSAGANPNITDHQGSPALKYAIQYGAPTTTELLCPITSEGRVEVLNSIAISQLELTETLQQFIRQCQGDRVTVIAGLWAAGIYGAAEMLTLLTQNIPRDSLPSDVIYHLLHNAVMSDSPSTCKAVLTLTSSIPEQTLTVARERGNREIVTLLLPNTEDRTAEEKEILKTEIVNRTAGLLNLLTKSVEFDYNEKIDKMKPLMTSSTVSYPRLIQELHVPPVHVGMEMVKEMDDDPFVTPGTHIPGVPLSNLLLSKEDFKDCPKECRQKRGCLRIRETYELAKIIKNKLGEINPVFKGMKTSIVGSIREGTRAFFNDESDIHLSLDQTLKMFTVFDAEDQTLKRNPNKTSPNNTNHYFSADNVFNAHKFFFDYIYAVHSIVSTLKLPTNFTMSPLTTNFTPCTRCMSTEFMGTPQARRCRHIPDCEAHSKCQCKDTSKCDDKCEHQCECKEYTSPSLSWTKIGVVLHLQWVEEDGEKVNIDCDLNVPTVPCGTPYDGRIDEAAQYFERERPYGWVEEVSKLEDMQEARGMPHMDGQDSWQIKFRLINKDTVVSRQSLLFMNDQTLRNVKAKIYVIIKVLKYCTGSSAKSYQCKLAVNNVLKNRFPSMEEIGSYVREVIDYMTLRGKFSFIHPDLKKEGIIRVEVGDDGLHFIRENNEGDHVKQNASPLSEIFHFLGLDDEQMLNMATAMSLAQEEDMEEEEMMMKAMAMSLKQEDAS